MGLPEAWPDVPQLAEPSLSHPRQFLLSPTQAGLPSPQRGGVVTVPTPQRDTVKRGGVGESGYTSCLQRGWIS